MLYGNIVFIKKSGGDGSKYPVTEKNIKIGKSEKCMIRIYNPQIAPVHCQLIIDDNGQAKLKNLSSLTILNGKPMGQNEMTLCHGDIFKLGDRLARWEYLQSSKYYKQMISPSGRLVAVVIPQQRSMEQEMTKASTPRMLRKTPSGGKRKFSERGTSENGSVSRKVAKIGSNSVSKTSKSMSILLAGRHSLQSTKMLFSPRVKQRKSTSGVLSSKVSKVQVSAKNRKSTLPSWKVNLISSPNELKLEGSKTPHRIASPKPTENLLKSVHRNAVKIQNLKTLVDSSLSNVISPVTLTSVSSSVKVSDSTVLPSGSKSTPKAMRLTKSEKKVSGSRKSIKSSKRLSLSFKPTSKTPTKTAVKKIYENLSKTASPNVTQRSPKNRSPDIFDLSAVVETPKNTHDKSRISKDTAESKILLSALSKGAKTPSKLKSTPQKVFPDSTSSDQKKLRSSMSSGVSISPGKSSAKKTPKKSKKSLLKVATPFSKPTIATSPSPLTSPSTSAEKFTRKGKKVSVKVISPRSSMKSVDESFSSVKKTPVKTKKMSVKPATPFPVSSGKKLTRSHLSPDLLSLVEIPSGKKSDKKSRSSSKSTSLSIFSPESNESVLQSPYVSFSEKLSISSKTPKGGTSTKVSTPFKVSTGKMKLKTKLSPILSPSLKASSLSKSSKKKSTHAETSLQSADKTTSPSKRSFLNKTVPKSTRPSRASSEGIINKERSSRSLLSPAEVSIGKKTAEKISGSPSKKSPAKKTPTRLTKSQASVASPTTVVSDSSVNTRFSSSPNKKTSGSKSSPKVATPKTDFSKTPSDKSKRLSKELKTPPVEERITRTNSNMFSPIKTPSPLKSSGKKKTPVKGLSRGSVSPKQKVASPAKRSPGIKSPTKNKKTSEVTSPQKVDTKSTKKLTPNRKTPVSPTTGRSSLRDTFADKNSVKGKSKSPRGIRRKLSPSISSAERAAKKLKTSTPKIPDKNKKAALMVLGIANRKLMNQDVKVLLKKKIVKKAIKQSTTVAAHKDKKTAKLAAVKKIQKSKKVAKKGMKKKVSKTKKVTTPKKSPKSQTPNKGKIETPLKETSKSQIRVSLQKTPGSPFKSTSEPVLSTSPSKSVKKLSSPAKQVSSKTSPVKQSPLTLINAYAFNANRRSSKRLSSKNDITRPDFTELSPTALGLIPKHIEVFKTPKEKKRRSLSLTTPKNVRTTSIIKSASTSKIVNRKSVRFSSKNISIRSPIYDPNVSQKTEFDFESIKTPDITMDTFISPLSEKKSSILKSDLNKSAKFLTFMDEPTPGKSPKSLGKVGQTPSPKMSPTKSSGSSKRSSPTNISISERQLRSPNKVSRDQRINISGVKSLFSSPESIKSPKSPKSILSKTTAVSNSPKSPKVDLSNVQNVRALRTGKVQNSPKNDLSDVRGVKKLLQTPRVQKSPKNDLTDVGGVKQLLKTPRQQKSPRNDLSNVDGVKRLLRTPRQQKSPKNDLTDVAGVKKLLKTPRQQKSPKNDLTDVAGVKKLLKTPRQQKSPKNDLTNVAGVKQLLKTPRQQKSPKNDLTDVAGVKQLMKTPRQQKSPKNDLSNVAGVKQLMKTPREQKSPRNDLSDLRGVRQLLGSPKPVKSPRNDLSDLRGVRQLLGSPKPVKSPKNDLSDLTGVRKLLTSPRHQKSPRNDLLDISGVGNLFQSPRTETYAYGREMLKSPQSPKSLRNSITTVTGVKQLLISNSSGKFNNPNLKVKSRLNSFKAIRGRRTIYSTPKSPKNDLSDLTGVKELFMRNEAVNELNSTSSVAQLFDLPSTGAEGSKKQEKTREVSRSRKGAETGKKETVTEVIRKGRLRKATQSENKSVTRGGVEQKTSDEIIETRTTKRKAVAKTSTSPPKKTLRGRSRVKITSPKALRDKKTKSVVETPTKVVENEKKESKSSKKRKAVVEKSEPSPPKLRRRQAATSKEEVSNSNVKKGVSKRGTSSKRQPLPESPKKESPASKKSSAKARTTKLSKKGTSTKVQSEITTNTDEIRATSIPKVQKGRSQSKSSAEKSKTSEKVSPRKTRSGKAVQKQESKVVSQEKKSKVLKKTVGLKVSKSASAKKKVSPAIKRSTRRK